MKMLDNAHKIAIYIRLSVEDKNKKVESVSVSNQRLLLRKYVDEHFPETEVAEFVDDGYTGTNFERPAVQRLLGQVQEGQINCIIVKDFSRFGRNRLEVGYFVEQVFPLYGVRFIAVNDYYDSDDYKEDTGGINMAFKYLVNEQYSRDLGKKSLAARIARAKKGETIHKHCPYGYKKVDNQLVIDDYAASVVRKIFSLFANGNSTTQIARILCDEKILTPAEYRKKNNNPDYELTQHSYEWGRYAILTALRNEQYIGTYLYLQHYQTEFGKKQVRKNDRSKWIIIPNHHDAIISADLFEDVQQKIRKVKRTGCQTHSYSRIYPLKGVMKCGYCHKGMLRLTSSRRSNRWKCSCTLYDDCQSAYAYETEIEKTIYDIIRKQAQIIMNIDISDIQNDNLPSRLTEYQNQITETNDKMRTLFEQLIRGDVAQAEFSNQQEALELTVRECTEKYNRVKEHEEKEEHRLSLLTEAKQEAKRIYEYDKLTNEMVKELIEAIYVYGENNIEIKWKFDSFFDEKNLEKVFDMCLT